jgi:phthalate 4,5-cis-dihydrodiol dehydrogenase
LADSSTIRIGIAGLGGAARQMIPAMVKHPGVEIVAAADLDTDAIEAFVADQGARSFTDVAQMCAETDIDAVYIATPNQFHLDHALAAFEHGKHLLLEKPMAMTLEESDAIIEEGERRNLVMVVCSPHSFAPPTTAILDMLSRGELGALRMINSWYYGDWLYRPRTGEELSTDQKFGGGVVFRQGPHMFDMIRTIAGGVGTSISATVGAWDETRPVPGSYSAFLQFENGVAATAVYSGYDMFHTGEITYGHSEPRSDDRYAKARRELAQATGFADELAMKRAGRYGGDAPIAVFRPEAPRSFSWISDLLFVATGDKGEVRITPSGCIFYGQDEVRQIELDVDETGRDGLVRQLYDAIVNGVRPTHDGRWAKGTLEVCLGVMESSKQGAPVALRHQRPLHVTG